MPLNLKDDADDSAEEKQPHVPILHQPGQHRRVSPLLVITIILVLLLGVAGVLIYQSGLWKKLRPKQAEAVHPPAAAPAEVRSPDTIRAAPEIAPEVRQQPPDAGTVRGGFTIFVSRQKERERADGEAGRWKDAGYAAEVVEMDGWYCVAVGRYASREEAREVAEKLKEGLEGGYWIGSRE
jgi:septal ring-binding cell division protein DamX